MFSISIVFLSWIIGMIATAVIRKTKFYNNQLSNLNFVKSDFLNIILGVGMTKWIIKNSFFKFFNQKLKIDRKVNFSFLDNLRKEMTKSEIDHLFAFVFVQIFMFLILYKQQYLFALIILVVNILMNLNPSLLQQQNKRRIDKFIRKFQ